MPDTVAFVGDQNFQIPVYMEGLVQLEGLEIIIKFDDSIIEYIDYSVENSILEDYNIFDNNFSDSLNFAFYSVSNLFSGNGNVLFLNFNIIGDDQDYTDLIFTNVEIQNNSIQSQNGSLGIYIPGCMENESCNYNSFATFNLGCIYAEENFDCSGNCIASGEGFDEEGLDCAGECGGLAVEDECGECGGGGIDEGACDCAGNILDCAGECGGLAVEDECGVCNGENEDDLGCGCDLDAPIDCGNGILDCAYNCLSSNYDFPITFSINNIYPNPFNSSTTISYSLDQFEKVKILVYSIQGKLINILVDEIQKKGEYSISWNSKDMPSGIYIVRLISNDESKYSKILLIK